MHQNTTLNIYLDSKDGSFSQACSMKLTVESTTLFEVCVSPKSLRRDWYHFFPKYASFLPENVIRSYLRHKVSYVTHLHSYISYGACIIQTKVSYRYHSDTYDNIHACCIWIHSSFLYHTTSFTACIIYPTYIIRSMSHNNVI